MKYIIAIILLSLSSFSFGEQLNCKQVAGLAESIMESRQENHDITELMAVSDLPLAHDMIIEAYKLNRYSTPKYQQASIRNFKNDWYMGCIEFKQDNTSED